MAVDCGAAGCGGHDQIDQALLHGQAVLLRQQALLARAVRRLTPRLAEIGRKQDHIMATQDDERRAITDLTATFTAYKDAVTVEFTALEAAIAALPTDIVPQDITDSLASLKTAITGAGLEIPPAPGPTPPPA